MKRSKINKVTEKSMCDIWAIVAKFGISIIGVPQCMEKKRHEKNCICRDNSWGKLYRKPFLTPSRMITQKIMLGQINWIIGYGKLDMYVFFFCNSICIFIYKRTNFIDSVGRFPERTMTSSLLISFLLTSPSPPSIFTDIILISV